MQGLKTGRRGLTAVELSEVEASFRSLLYAKHFPHEWIEENAPDLLAQAHAEYAKRQARGCRDDAVPLLITIAYRRAIELLKRELRRPRPDSIDSMFQVADDSTPTPEEEAIDRDRQERIVRALASLPESECKLLRLVYFDGLSIREAGRRLGWGKSVADRRHRAALASVRPLLGDRRFLAGDIAAPAFIAAVAHRGDPGPLRRALAQLAELGRRLAPFTEPANAAAMGGAGRGAAIACGGAVAVACSLAAATGVVGPGVAARDGGPRPHAKASPVSASGPFVPAPSPVAEEQSSEPQGSEPSAVPTARSIDRAAAKLKASSAASGNGREADAAAMSEAPVEQSATEFGVESSAGSSGTGSGTSSSAASSGVSSAAARPTTSAASGGGGSATSAPASSGGGSEFGM